MPNVIKIKSATTANLAPSSLVAGELALNRADGQLYYLNSSSSSIAMVNETIDGGELLPSAGIVLNFNGSNNGTTFTHSGSSSPTITRVGSVVTSTTQVKYGTASGYFPGSGSCLDFASSSALNMGTGDFTIEMWVYPTALDGNTTILRLGSDAGGGSSLLFGHSTGRAVYASSNGSTWDIVNGSALTGLTTNSWQHIALTRTGNTYRGFVGGSAVFTTTSSLSLYNANTTARLGAANSGGVYAFQGYIDDLRIVVGYSVYQSASFTPPAAQLTSSL